MKHSTRNAWKTTMTLALATLLVSASAAVAADDVRVKQDTARQATAAAKAGSGEEIDFSDPTTGPRTAACLTRTADDTCGDDLTPPPPPPSGGNRICDFMNAVFGDAVNIQFLCP